MPGLATDDDALFELRARTLDPTLSPALLGDRGAVRLPVELVLRFLAVPHRWEGAVLHLARPAGEGWNRIDVDAVRIQVDGQAAALDPADLVLRAGDWFADTEVLARVLEGEVEIDREEVAITFRRGGAGFPAQIRRRIEEERERMVRQRQAAAPEALPDVPFRPGTGGAVLEWGLTTSGPLPITPSAGHAVAGLGVLGGELVAGAAVSGGVADPAARLDRISYQRVFPEGRWVGEVRLGDVATPGVHREPLRGAVVTNVPRYRDRIFDTIGVRPDLPAGWEYEVYQGGELLGFSGSDTDHAVEVPLRYGTTPVRVRMLGPAGEEVVSEYFHQVPRHLLQAGRFEYALAAGACRGERCDRLAIAEARHGILRNLTLGGGLRYAADSLQATLRPGATGLWLPAPGWLAEAEYAPGLLQELAVRYDDPARGSAALRGGVRMPGLGSFAVPPAGGDRWYLDAAGGRRLGVGPVRSVRLGVLAEGPRGDRPDRFRASATTSLAGGFLEARYESSPLLNRDQVTLRGSTPRLGIAPSLGTRGSLGVSFDGAGARLLDAAVGISPGPRTRLDLRAQWLPARTPMIGLGFSTRTGTMRVQGRTSSAAGGVTSAVGLSGALAVDRQAGIHAFDRQGIQAAGIQGRVFYDHSGDGLFGPGDEVAGGIPVRVGALRVESDARGVYRTWALQPYRATSVRIDTLAIGDPAWTPLVPETRVRPTPHMFSRIDIPLVRTRELFGRLEPGPGVRTAGGVSLEIEHATTGERTAVTTFQDGSFYLTRLRPGAYRLVISPRSLDILGATVEAATVQFEVPASGEEPVVELPPIPLQAADGQL